MTPVLRPVMRLRRAALAALAFALAATSAQARYELQPGDTVEIAVAGLPAFGRTATVDIDGYVDVPLIGPLVVAGRTVEDVRQELTARLPTLAFTQRTPDGTEFQSAIEAEAIGVRIAEYGPIYVEGHVGTPGQQPFRPGLVARQALAQAGGNDLMRLQPLNPVLTAADLRAEIRDLRLEWTRLEISRERVAAELAGQSDLGRGDQGEAAGHDDFTGRVIAGEAAELEARQERLSRDQASLREAQARLSERLGFLREQLEKERSAATADLESEARVRDSYERRLTPFRQVAEAQRFSLSSEARVRAVSAEIAEAEREMEGLRRAEGRLEDDRRVDLLEEAQGIDARIAAIGARLSAAAEKLAHVDGVGSGVLGYGPADMIVEVIRQGGEGTERIDADLDTALRPGDVVAFRFPDAVLDEIFGTAGARPRDGGAGAGAGLAPPSATGFASASAQGGATLGIVPGGAAGDGQAMPPEGDRGLP